MDGFSTAPVKSLGPAPGQFAGSFAPNGTASPLAASSRYPVGFNFSVSRSDTGTHIVTVPAGCGLPAQPHSIEVTPQADAAGDWFEAMVVGESTLTASTRTFTVFLHRNGTARDPAAAAGTRVNFSIKFDRSTGR